MWWRYLCGRIDNFVVKELFGYCQRYFIGGRGFAKSLLYSRVQIEGFQTWGWLDLSWHTIHCDLFQVSGGTFSRGLAGGSREELMGIKAISTSLPALPLASVTSSWTSPLGYIIKAGSNLDFNVLRASLASSLNLISLCSKIFHSNPSDLLTTSSLLFVHP